MHSSSNFLLLLVESTAIRAVHGKRHDLMSIEQGKTLSVRLECVNQNGEVVQTGDEHKIE